MCDVLTIRDLSKSFARNRVLNGVNFRMGKGAVVGLMGENGADRKSVV